jgi:hypothetical protein
MERWSPNRDPTRQEEFILKRLEMKRKLFGFLRRHRHELFDDGFQAEDGDDVPAHRRRLEPDPAGAARDGALAARLRRPLERGCGEAAVMVMDLRWQMVLATWLRPSRPSRRGTLQTFRERLIAHDMDGGCSSARSTWRRARESSTGKSSRRRCAWPSIRLRSKERAVSRTASARACWGRTSPRSPRPAPAPARPLPRRRGTSSRERGRRGSMRSAGGNPRGGIPVAGIEFAAMIISPSRRHPRRSHAKGSGAVPPRSERRRHRRDYAARAGASSSSVRDSLGSPRNPRQLATSRASCCRSQSMKHVRCTRPTSPPASIVSSSVAGPLHNGQVRTRRPRWCHRHERPAVGRTFTSAPRARAISFSLSERGTRPLPREPSGRVLRTDGGRCHALRSDLKRSGRGPNPLPTPSRVLPDGRRRLRKAHVRRTLRGGGFIGASARPAWASGPQRADCGATRWPDGPARGCGFFGPARSYMGSRPRRRASGVRLTDAARRPQFWHELRSSACPRWAPGLITRATAVPFSWTRADERALGSEQ